MQISSFDVRFTVPAFLGNAEQSAQWRTPPFKAQLRQWWRVAYAAQHHFDVDLATMRYEEGRLFGHAWLQNDTTQDGRRANARRSQVRLHLSRWDSGSLTNWQPVGKVSPPGPHAPPMDSDVYLGYGPIKPGSKLKGNAAIQAGEQAALSLAYPEAATGMMEAALQLMHQYGAVGGRSRNGWGSYLLSRKDGTSNPSALDARPFRDWRDCLRLDWPHAIGTDEYGPLVWQTKAHPDWKALMTELAKIKIGFRTQFRFIHGKRSNVKEDRHWLSYPVTDHSIKEWGPLRLPNSLRFKVRTTADKQLVGVILHVPCAPIASFQPEPRTLESVWQRVHQFLDQPDVNLHRIAE